MDRSSFPSRCAAISGIVTVLLSTATPLAAGQKGPPRHYEARAESALVYFVRSRLYAGSANTVLLFADDRFLGVLDNATWFASYLPPGRHLFWTQDGASREMQLIAGRTYHLACSFYEITAVDEMAGADLLARGVRHITPMPKEEQTGARYVQKYYPTAPRRGDDAPAPEPATSLAAPGGDHDGRAWLPKWTEIRLELLEATSSAYDATGDPVRFEIAEDVVVNGAVVIARGTHVDGTIRQAAPAPSARGGFFWRTMAVATGLGSGRNVAVVEGGGWDKHGEFHEATAAKPGSVGGVLDVAVASVLARDGTLVPVIGLPASEQSERFRAATGTALGYGVFGKFAVPGVELYHLRGEEVTVATSEDTWLAAVSDAADPVLPSGDEAEARLVAQATMRVELSPGRRRSVPPVILAVHADAPVLSAAITAIGGRELPNPPSSTRLVPFVGGTTCDFDGWSVVRLLHAAPGEGDNRAEIRGTLADGRSFVAEVDLELDVR